MAPIPPVLSVAEDISLPDLDKILSSNAIPASLDLTTLNDNLNQLAASAEARAEALRRDVQLLQQTYSSLRAKVRKEGEELRNPSSENMSRQSSSNGQAAATPASMNGPPNKKRRSDIGDTIGGAHFMTPISKYVQPLRQPSPNGLPGSDLSLPDRAEPTVELTTTSDPEEMKRRLGVAYFPTQDLSHLLPGKPSYEDYSKQKIPNQIAMSTFLSSIDPFFRPFTEEDLGWLRDRGDRLGPFIIPPLGTHYSDLWNEPTEESASPKVDTSQKAKDSAENMTDDNIPLDAVSCGPLTSRLLSAFIKEDDASPVKEESDGTDKDKASRIGVFRMDYTELEEKLNDELRFIGLLDSTPIDWTQTADDEISAKLRSLQGQLQTQMATNIARKQKLMSLTTDEMAKDEYTTILDDLDKQVEQAFLKRTRGIKATKKKRLPGEKGQAITKVGIGSNIRTLMDKRQKWIQTIGSICTTEPISDKSRFDDLDGALSDQE